MTRGKPQARIRLALASAAAATVALTIAGDASAQATAAGPGTPKRETELRLSLEGQYNSNVARRSAQEAQRLGLVRADERLTPTAELTIARPLGRNTLELDALVGYDFYRRNTRLNRERILVGGKSTLASGPCYLDLNVDFSRRQSDLADLAAAQFENADSVDNTQTEQNYGGALRCGRRYGLQPTLTVNRSVGDNSNELRRISDYRSFTFGGGVTYARPVLGTYSLILNQTKTDYPNRNLLPGGDGFKTTRATLSGTRDMGAVLQASASLSYIDVSPDSGSASSFSGLGWSLALTAIPTPDLRVTASTSRDAMPSLGTDALYQLTNNYELGASYAIGPRTTLAVDGAIRKLDYRGIGTTFGPLLTHSVQRSISGTLTQRFARRLGVAAEVGYQERSTNNAIYDYDSFYAGLRLTFTL